MHSSASRPPVIFLGESNSAADSASSVEMCLQENLDPAVRLELAQSIQKTVADDAPLQEVFSSLLSNPTSQRMSSGFSIFKFLVKKSGADEALQAHRLTKRVAAAIALLESPRRNQAMEILMEVARIPSRKLPRGGDVAAIFARQYVYRTNLNAMRSAE